MTKYNIIINNDITQSTDTITTDDPRKAVEWLVEYSLDNDGTAGVIISPKTWGLLITRIGAKAHNDVPFYDDYKKVKDTYDSANAYQLSGQELDSQYTMDLIPFLVSELVKYSIWWAIRILQDLPKMNIANLKISIKK